MTTEAIVTALLRAASVLKKPIEDAAAQGIKDLYAAAKARLLGKLGGNPRRGRRRRKGDGET
jgi:hypothetical protein